MPQPRTTARAPATPTATTSCATGPDTTPVRPATASPARATAPPNKPTAGRRSGTSSCRVGRSTTRGYVRGSTPTTTESGHSRRRPLPGDANARWGRRLGLNQRPPARSNGPGVLIRITSVDGPEEVLVHPLGGLLADPRAVDVGGPEVEAGEDPAVDRVADVVREPIVVAGFGRALQVERHEVRPEEGPAAVHHRRREAVVARRLVRIAG